MFTYLLTLLVCSGLVAAVSACVAVCKVLLFTASLYVHAEAAPPPSDQPCAEKVHVFRTSCWVQGSLSCLMMMM